MGWFKNVVNSGLGVVNNVTGTRLSVGSSSNSDLGAALKRGANKLKAEKALAQKFLAEYTKTNRNATSVDVLKALGSYIKTSEYAKALATAEGALNAGHNAESNTFKDAVNQAVGTIKDSLVSGVKTASDGLINKAVAGVLGSNPAKNWKDTLSDYTATIGSSAIGQMFKKNWYWIVLPIPVGIALWYFMKKKPVKRGARRRK